MPDHRKLKIGDKIRILSVPKADIKQRKREIAEGQEMAGWTANTIELIIAQTPIVEIDTITEFGQAWFTCEIRVNGELETHEMAIVDDESWEMV